MGTPANFNGFRVLTRYSSSGRQRNFAALNRGRHLLTAERPSRWALAHILVYLFMPFFRNSPTDQTCRRIFAHEGSYNAESRKDMPFCFVDMAPHLGGQIPKKYFFGGVNRCFQAEVAKSKSIYVIKTVASIPIINFRGVRTSSRSSITMASLLEPGFHPSPGRPKKIERQSFRVRFRYEAVGA